MKAILLAVLLIDIATKLTYSLPTYGAQSTSPSYFDPCLRMPCKQYEICVSSKNGLQYNCISEPRPVKKTVTTINFKPTVQLIKQTPTAIVKTTPNVIHVNPCLSSPCGFKQICKTVPERPFQFFCEDEVELNVIKQTIFEPEQKDQVTNTLNTILRKIETGQFYNKVKDSSLNNQQFATIIRAMLNQPNYVKPEILPVKSKQTGGLTVYINNIRANLGGYGANKKSQAVVAQQANSAGYGMSLPAVDSSSQLVTQQVASQYGQSTNSYNGALPTQTSLDVTQQIGYGNTKPQVIDSSYQSSQVNLNQVPISNNAAYGASNSIQVASTAQAPDQVAVNNAYGSNSLPQLDDQTAQSSGSSYGYSQSATSAYNQVPQLDITEPSNGYNSAVSVQQDTAQPASSYGSATLPQLDVTASSSSSYGYSQPAQPVQTVQSTQVSYGSTSQLPPIQTTVKQVAQPGNNYGSSALPQLDNSQPSYGYGSSSSAVQQDAAPIANSGYGSQVLPSVSVSQTTQPANNYGSSSLPQLDTVQPAGNYGYQNTPQLQNIQPTNNYGTQKVPQLDIQTPTNSYGSSAIPQLDNSQPSNNYGYQPASQQDLAQPTTNSYGSASLPQLDSISQNSNYGYQPAVQQDIAEPVSNSYGNQAVPQLDTVQPSSNYDYQQATPQPASNYGSASFPQLDNVQPTNSYGYSTAPQQDLTQPTSSYGTSSLPQLDNVQPADNYGYQTAPQQDISQPSGSYGNQAAPQLDVVQPTNNYGYQATPQQDATQPSGSYGSSGYGSAAAPQLDNSQPTNSYGSQTVPQLDVVQPSNNYGYQQATPQQNLAQPASNYGSVSLPQLDSVPSSNNYGYQATAPQLDVVQPTNSYGSTTPQLKETPAGTGSYGGYNQPAQDLSQSQYPDSYSQTQQVAQDITPATNNYGNVQPVQQAVQPQTGYGYGQAHGGYNPTNTLTSNQAPSYGYANANYGQQGDVNHQFNIVNSHSASHTSNHKSEVNEKSETVIENVINYLNHVNPISLGNGQYAAGNNQYGGSSAGYGAAPSYGANGGYGAAQGNSGNIFNILNSHTSSTHNDSTTTTNVENIKRIKNIQTIINMINTMGLGPALDQYGGNYGNAAGLAQDVNGGYSSGANAGYGNQYNPGNNVINSFANTHSASTANHKNEVNTKNVEEIINESTIYAGQGYGNGGYNGVQNQLNSLGSLGSSYGQPAGPLNAGLTAGSNYGQPASDLGSLNAGQGSANSYGQPATNLGSLNAGNSYGQPATNLGSLNAGNSYGQPATNLGSLNAGNSYGQPATNLGSLNAGNNYGSQYGSGNSYGQPAANLGSLGTVQPKGNSYGQYGAANKPASLGQPTSQYGYNQGGLAAGSQYGAAPQYGSSLGAARFDPLGNSTQGSYCSGFPVGAKIAYPFDASKFIFCKLNGQYDILDCPTSLVFNAELDRCDYFTSAPSGCSTFPCQYGGTCTDMANGQYVCTCQPGYAGANCEVAAYDACASNPCGPRGQCFPLAPIAPISYYCLCDNQQTFGLSCSAYNEPNPCRQTSEELFYPTILGKQLFVHCNYNHFTLKYCYTPLTFSSATNNCEWQGAVQPSY